MKKKISTLCFAALALLALVGNASAVDGWSVEAGGGNGVDVGRIGAQWKWDKKWFTSGEYHVAGYWDLQAGSWHGASHITDFSLTPTFRLERQQGYGGYLEAAIG